MNDMGETPALIWAPKIPISSRYQWRRHRWTPPNCSGRAGRRRSGCPRNFAFEGEEVRIRRHGDAVILEPVASDWAWLNTAVGQLDEDAARAAGEQIGQQDRPALDALFR